MPTARRRAPQYAAGLGQDGDPGRSDVGNYSVFAERFGRAPRAQRRSVGEWRLTQLLCAANGPPGAQVY